MSSRLARAALPAFAALAGLLLSAACQKTAPPPVAAPVAPPPPARAPDVLDAVSDADRAWVYADGRLLRTDLLPELIHAVGALRADVEVGIAAARLACGFDPLLSVDQTFVRVRWDTKDPRPPWSAVVRLAVPADAAVKCLRALVPDAAPSSLDGRPAWQLHRALVVSGDGVFVVASSPVEAHATLERLRQPEAAAVTARGSLAGVALAARAADPNPFGMDALDLRQTPRPPGTELELHARFAREMAARQAETLVGDGLTGLLGPVPLDAESQRRADEIVHSAKVARDGSKLDVRFSVPPIAGRAALASRLVAVVVRGVKLYSSWDLAAEARDSVFAIARGLVDFANLRRSQGKAPRFPPSAPLVPDHIPAGKRVTPNPHGFLHPSWQDVHYGSDKPTYYAVEFVTAKDGKSAVVRARGDIDDNGITSLFELDVKLDARDTPSLAPVMRERDPGE